MCLGLHEGIIRETLGDALCGHGCTSGMRQVREHGELDLLVEGNQKLEWRTWQHAGDERHKIIGRCESGCERTACFSGVTHGLEERSVAVLDLRVVCIEQ